MLLEYIFIYQAKTTKKDVYTLNPTYLLLKPGNNSEIKFIYNIKDLNEGPEKHKFKFEGIIVPDEVINKDVKTIFDYISKNKVCVIGCVLKRNVLFNNLKLSKTVIQHKSTIKDIDVNRSLNLNRLINDNNDFKESNEDNSRSR